VRYAFAVAPIIVNCCHCSWCQRETGSAFVINAVVETAELKVSGETIRVDTPSASARGQQIVRCPKCQVALWSHYASAGPGLAFVRVGTLDNPNACQPDVHIFTSTKQGWLKLPDGVLAFTEFYNPREVWSAEALVRARKATGR
jgi:hypothetical protein